MTHKIKEKETEFWKKLSDFEIIANDIIQKKSISKIESENWVNQIVEFLNTNIIPSPDSIIKAFQYSYDERTNMFFTFSPIGETQEDITRHKINQFKFKLNEFKKLKGYLSVINSLNNDNVSTEINSVKEKLDFTMEKLYYLYGDNYYYSIALILESNNINLRDDEAIEICESLEKKGYAIKEEKYSKKDSVKLSLKGAEYVERKKRGKRNNEKKKSQSETNKKIDLVLRKLEELGYGQEIIFEEIEELRGLSKKLNKKTWSQVIKGKVVDLALSELISKDVATFIYESLVEDKFKLLK